MPLSLLSKQNGTVMCLEKLLSPEPRSSASPRFASSNSNSHWPLRFSHSPRWNCGWGYSGRGTSLGAAMASQATPARSIRRGRIALPHGQVTDVDVLEPHIALAPGVELQGDRAVEGFRRGIGEVEDHHTVQARDVAVGDHSQQIVVPVV